jgi:heme/copper-type cytochrome/quinol oxidase subunit 1
MAMTETRPEAASTEVPSPSAPVEAAGLAGWLTTSDHKRIGRLFIGASLLFLITAAVLTVLLWIERLDTGADLLKNDTFPQVFTLQGEVLALLFVVPFFLGLATYLVPLQVGSPEIAFPRGSATAFWGYLVGAGLLVASYAADGGITGTTPSSVDLYLLSLLLLVASLTLGAISVVTTAFTMRAPGMTLLQTPLFSWSVVVGGGLLLLQLPVLGARVIEVFIEVHHGGAAGTYGAIRSSWGLPAVYGLVVMAAGVLLEIVPTLAAQKLRFHVAGVVVLGLLGVLGIGGWLTSPEAVDDLLFVGMGLAAVLPAIALLGILADTARAGTPAMKAPLVLAIAAALLLLAGAAAGAVQVIEPLELAETSWESGQVHLVLFGGAVLAAFAALWFWGPKIWGAHLSEKVGFLVALLVLGGAVLPAAADLVAGAAEDLPRGALEWSDADLVDTTGGLGVAGAALGAVGVLAGVGAVLAAAGRRRSVPAVDDPWGGWTLEWTTTSPPPAHNFEVTPEVKES